MSFDICLHCACPATVQVVTGEELCAHCYEHAPLVVGCPNCTTPISPDVDADSIPVAAAAVRPSDAPADSSPSSAGATIALLVDVLHTLDECAARIHRALRETR